MTQLPFTFARFLWLPGDVGVLELTGDLDVPRWAVPYTGARLRIDGEVHPCILVPCAHGPVGRRQELWALRFRTPSGFDPALVRRYELSLPTYEPIALPAPELPVAAVSPRRRIPRTLRTALIAATLGPLAGGPLAAAAGATVADPEAECIVETGLLPDGEPCPPQDLPPVPDPPKPEPPKPEPPKPEPPKPEPPAPDPPAPEPEQPGQDKPEPQDKPDHGKPQDLPPAAAAAVPAPVVATAVAPAPAVASAGDHALGSVRKISDARRRAIQDEIAVQQGESTHRTAGGRGGERRSAVRRVASKVQRAVRRTAPAAAATLTSDAPTGFVLPSAAYGGEPDIPAFLLPIYHRAARRYDIPWSVLAAVNEIETDFGRNVAVSSAGARGWMQFMPGTWRAYGVDADRDGRKDWDDPEDAIFAAARYLRASGGRSALRRALFAYNHAHWYVEAVLLRAARISQLDGRSPSVRRLLEDSDRRLRRRVVEDERIKIYECGREDVLHKAIDRRVLLLLLYLAESDLHPTVTSLRCGHSIYTSSGNISHHSTGDAVDIAAINDVPILGNQGPGSVTDIAVRQILRLKGALAPAQIITLMEYPDAPNTFAMGDHHDHIHVGFRPERGDHQHR